MNLRHPDYIDHPMLGGQLWFTISACGRSLILHFAFEKTRNAISGAAAEQLASFSRAVCGLNSTHPVAAFIAGGRLVSLIIRSHCKDVFLSGGDLGDVARMSEDEGHNFIENMRCFTEMLRSGPLVSIAVLNGLAAGGGSEIALAADLRLAVSQDARCHFAQAHWGVPSGWGLMSDFRSKKLLGSERRRGIAIASQEQWDIETLLRMGLIDACFATDNNPQSACDAWIENFNERLNRCPLELRSELITHRSTLPADKLDEFDKLLFQRCWLAPEHRARIGTFLNRRTQPARED